MAMLEQQTGTTEKNVSLGGCGYPKPIDGMMIYCLSQAGARVMVVTGPLFCIVPACLYSAKGRRFNRRTGRRD